MNTKIFNITRIISIGLLFFTGINAIIAGILFLTDPSGGKMGMTTTYLNHTPFSTFLIPGLILIIVNGLMNVCVAVLTLKKYKYFTYLIILQGLLLSGWIIVQVIMVRDFNGLHFFMLSIGIILFVFGIILNRQINFSPSTLM